MIRISSPRGPSRSNWSTVDFSQIFCARGRYTSSCYLTSYSDINRKGSGMDDSLKIEMSEIRMVAHLSEQMALMTTFAVAVARSHPDPKELLAAFERTIVEDEEGEVPNSELTPDNLQARNDRCIVRDMLLRVVRARIA